MEGLRVLSLDVSSLPRSLSVLKNLTTLCLKVPKFEDMSWIGSLICLEFLSISTLSLTDIPDEMRQLRNLRLLDLRKMKLAYIPAGVFSRMLKLEELYLPLNSRRWGCKAKEEHDDYDEWESRKEDNCDEEEGINAVIHEIVSPSLHTLQLSIPKASSLPKDSRIFKNIRQFKVVVPNHLKYQPFYEDMNVVQLMDDSCDIKEFGICDLMNRTEYLSLTRVRNLKNGIFQLEDEGFPCLKRMIISECGELECLVDTTAKFISPKGNCLFSKLDSLHLSMLPNLKEICYGRWNEIRWFPNLSQISIRFCHKLKYVFPLSIVRGLKLLKSIEILDCNEMEEIFHLDEENDDRYFIEKLDLHSLPKLIGLLVQKDNTINSVDVDTNQSLIPNENKDVIGYVDMYDALIPLKLGCRWLQNLKTLRIAFCDSIRWIDQKTFLPSQAGTGVAVSNKKLKWESPQRLGEWQLDVDFFEGKLHPNVVKLFGHCWYGKELLLVYEWMQRGSLDNHLFTSDPLIETLSWDVRLKIAIGAARGFDFLHTSGPKVIHRNIKLSNILLDGNYNAKISGFEFRRLDLLSDADSHMTKRAMGTLGYVDPAYVKTGHLDVKSDIYSFGVVLLELMTSLRVLDEKRPDGQQNLVDWLKPILVDGKKLTNIMDARMEGQYSSNAILLTAKLALKCTGNNPMNRPSMKEVVDALKQIRAIKGKEKDMT